MKKVVLLFMALVACVTFSQAQTKEEKARTRAERKLEQERIDALLFEEARQSIENRNFILEADRVIFKRGRSAFVMSNTNFVSVNGEHATVQVAFNVPGGGLNGLGGVTVDGRISGYKVTYGKKGNLEVSMNVLGVGISAQVNIFLPKGTNEASVDIYPNFNSNRLTLEGNIVPLEQSRVFKGTSF
jgi:hypothetical protein